MSVSQPALTPSTVSRRRFLTVAGAGVTTSALLTMLDARQAPAQIKGTTLRILQWSHFIPAYDAWFDNKFRSEEHTSELQSRRDLVCRLLLEKKKAWLSTFRKGCLGFLTPSLIASDVFGLANSSRHIHSSM